MISTADPATRGVQPCLRPSYAYITNATSTWIMRGVDSGSEHKKKIDLRCAGAMEGRDNRTGTSLPASTFQAIAATAPQRQRRLTTPSRLRFAYVNPFGTPPTILGDTLLRIGVIVLAVIKVKGLTRACGGRGGSFLSGYSGHNAVFTVRLNAPLCRNCSRIKERMGGGGCTH